jgi:hypothetical protein
MFEVLKFFNFGENFINWIKLFYNNIQSCININGHLSDWFYIKRGCRQGDPLSPYLFILCAEILSLLIKQNKDISGIKINNIEFLISQYADDTTLILDGTEKSLYNSLKVLKFYAEISGLHVNVDKTKAIWIGSMKGSENKLCHDIHLQWERDQFRLLGIQFSINLDEMISLNYTPKINEIKNLLSVWSKRILTPIGKNVVLKSLALAKLNHLFISLPNPNIDIIKQIQTMFFKFICGDAPDKVKRTVIIQKYEMGGLRVTDIEKFINALKVTWLRRFWKNDNKYFSLAIKICPFLSEFSNFGSDFITKKRGLIKNVFGKIYGRHI